MRRDRSTTIEVIEVVSIHAPREGCDLPPKSANFLPGSFNSRTPGGVRRLMPEKQDFAALVSIHAPREGCDKKLMVFMPPQHGFQFTHPGRGATCIAFAVHLVSKVSIHAPREGCDHRGKYLLRVARGFNSRTPGGVRREPSVAETHHIKFQFTHPGRGATSLGKISKLCLTVSIHAPREGCDYTLASLRGRYIMFQFTHPGRGATYYRGRCLSPDTEFQFTHPGRGATGQKSANAEALRRFNSRTPGGVRR